MISKEMEQLFNKLIQVEAVSTTLYLAMSAYMGRENFTGIAKWLRIQSDEERTHMIRLINYLVDRDGTVRLEAIPAQPSEFGTPLETFQKVLEHEQFVTNSYRQAFEYAKQVDPLSVDIIQQFLREQIEEEARAQTIVRRLKIAGNNPSAILLIDQELGQRQPAAGAAPLG